MRILLLPLMLLALAGCGILDPGGRSLLSGGTSLTATISNPVSLDTAYDVEVAVAGVRRIGLAAMRTRQCRRSEVVSATNVCVPRSVKLEIQKADAKLIAVLKPFRAFVRNNPSVSAASVAGEVYQAIKGYNATLFINGIQGAQ